jgi:ABC-2 type transport system permease protein
LIVPKGFGERYEKPFVKGFPEVETGMDPSRKAEQGLLQGVLAKYLFEHIADVFFNPDNARKLVSEGLAEIRQATDIDPLSKAALLTFLPALDRFLIDIPRDGEVEKINFGQFGVKNVEVAREDNRPKSAFDISFPQGIVWALLACAASFGISIVTERVKGTLVRLRMMPITLREILAGKAAACFVTTIGVTVALLLFARLVFGVRPDSLPLLAMAAVSTCICFVGIMMFLAVLGKTEQAAAGIGWAILMAMAMIGGGMIPLAFMPGWMQKVSHISPIKWTIYSLEGAIWRGFSLSEMLLPCGILVAIGVGCFLIGASAFRWSEQG